MRTRIRTLAGAALAAAALAAPAAAGAQPAAAQPAAGGETGSLEVYAAPGMGYHELRGGDGCHNYERSRTITFADAEPIATYTFYTGRDCTGRAVGVGRGDTQWMPPLDDVNSVRIDFE